MTGGSPRIQMTTSVRRLPDSARDLLNGGFTRRDRRRTPRPKAHGTAGADLNVGANATGSALTKLETLETPHTWAPASAMSGTTRSPRMDERVEKAVLFMEGNCHRKLSLRQIAAGVGMSRSRLSALFVMHFEVSPMRFLKAIRMRQAKALLQSSSLNIKEIAAYAGFNDMSHFVRDYGRLYGQSPTMTRNRELI
jgi:transcriptional regulator GlxA family with amidase domain